MPVCLLCAGAAAFLLCPVLVTCTPWQSVQPAGAYTHKQRCLCIVFAGPSTVLPSALAALHSLEGPPSYLNPEATRPLASSAYHGRHIAPGLMQLLVAGLQPHTSVHTRLIVEHCQHVTLEQLLSCEAESHCEAGQLAWVHSC